MQGGQQREGSGGHDGRRTIQRRHHGCGGEFTSNLNGCHEQQNIYNTR